MDLENGLWATQYLEPQLLEDFKNYKDDFIGVLKAPNPAAIGQDGILFNKLINNVEFKVNHGSTFTPVAMTGKKGLMEWDKLDTTPTLCTDAELRGMAFDKENAIRVEHTNSFRIGVRDYALNKLAPTTHSANTPVIRTTGATVDGRKRLTYEDLLGFYNLITRMNLNDKNGWHLVLSDEHRTDLMVDRSATSNYRDLEFDKNTGEVKRFFKLNLFENNDSPYYNVGGTKLSLGATPTADDRKASVFFYAPNTVYHIETVKVLYKPMNTDTRNADPQSEFRLHTYGLCDQKQKHGFGALVSAKV